MLIKIPIKYRMSVVFICLIFGAIFSLFDLHTIANVLIGIAIGIGLFETKICTGDK